MSYYDEIALDNPAYVWALDELSGNSAGEQIAGNDGEYLNDPTLGEPSLTGDGTAVFFNEDLDQGILTSYSVPSPDEFSVEMLFVTNGGRGILSGYGDVRDAHTGGVKSDRHLYIGDDDRLHFSVWGGSGHVDIVTPGPVNNGSRHHVVVTHSKSGNEIRLIVNGEVVDFLSVHSAQSYNGWWSFARSKSIAAPSLSQARYTGILDHIVIYDYPLTGTRAQAHANALPSYKVAGTVTDASSGGGLEAIVQVFDWDSGALRGQTVSSSINGTYELSGISSPSDVLVVMKPSGARRPLAHGPVTPKAQ